MTEALGGAIGLKLKYAWIETTNILGVTNNYWELYEMWTPMYKTVRIMPNGVDRGSKLRTTLLGAEKYYVTTPTKDGYNLGCPIADIILANFKKVSKNAYDLLTKISDNQSNALDKIWNDFIKDYQNKRETYYDEVTQAEIDRMVKIKDDFIDMEKEKDQAIRDYVNGKTTE